VEKTIVYGVNHQDLTADDLVISNASCTTNCLRPVAKVLTELCGIERGYMTTIHSYTNDQPSLDQMHKDLYRARGAGQSMIPTSTGAAKALGLVIPALKGKLDGSSIRVPTPNVSVVDFKFVPGRDVTVQEINAPSPPRDRQRPAQRRAGGDRGAAGLHRLQPPAASATVALPQTQVIEGRLARVLAWYDNEWGFSTRMADTALAMGKLL
jgi:glyceraldehyde 3-phosphate dehydrogenase